MTRLDSPRRWLLLFLSMTIFISFARPQFNPQYLGELGIQANTSSNVWIYLTNVGQVYGSRCLFYPPTSDYNSRDNSGDKKNLYLQQVDRNGCDGTGSQYFAFGLYQISIEGNTMQVDFRDADYEDGNGFGGFGTNYATADVVFYYNHNDGQFYSDANHTQEISSPVGIWQGGRKSGPPRIPVIVRNSFNGGYGGTVVVDNVYHSSPDSIIWTLGSHTLAAPLIQGGSWFFDHWSDGGAATHSVNVGLGQFSSVYTAYYVHQQRPQGANTVSANDPNPVNEKVNRIPSEVQLYQNYPNPFNPTTTIKYELPKASDVRLSVYDILGRQVSVLVNERGEAGVHEVKFDGSNLASGVYFYRLQAGDFVETKRLLLLK